MLTALSARIPGIPSATPSPPSELGNFEGLPTPHRNSALTTAAGIYPVRPPSTSTAPYESFTNVEADIPVAAMCKSAGLHRTHPSMRVTPFC